MAVEPGDADFKTKLSEESQKRAREELNELNDKDRELAVQSLRAWVLQQKWLKTPTDFGFLLRFLRARKGSQLGARQTLENYWTIKAQRPKWFKDVDPTDKTIQKILRTGFYVCPKALDRHGRRIVIENLGRIKLSDLKKEYGGVENLFKALTLICDWVNRDENIQVNGLYVFSDNSQVTMNHFRTMFTGDNGKNIMQFYQNSLPCRMKGLHLYNESAVFDAAFAFIGPFIKQKTKDRMHFHGKNMSNVYRSLDMHIFPKEYLPDDYEGPSPGTIDEIIEDMIADMTSPEFRNYISTLSSSKYGIDYKLKPKSEDVPVASFRKLNVD